MKRSAATLAIALTRLRRDADVVLAGALTCAIVAYLQRYDDRFEHLAGALVFTTIAGAGSALLLQTRRHRELTLCEEAAPLYGRELARARAIVPCATAAVAASAYWIVAALYAAPDPFFIALTAVSAFASSTAALCASVVRGAQRAVFLGFAAAICAISFALHTVPATALAIDVLVVYVTLRQYGEAIARG